MSMQALAYNEWTTSGDPFNMVANLGFKRTYWDCCAQLAFMTLTLQILAGTALKLLVRRVQ